jgi:phosphoribosylformylglycinamidine synthase
MDFLHQGLPRVTRKALWVKPYFEELKIKEPKNLTKYLKNILSSLNVCSKEWIIRQYDHEVQGASVLKPLVGVDNDGPSDACVIKPILNSKKGIIVSCGLNPKYGKIDPYWMAASAIDEALRQIISVGGSLKQVALLDNFCWGNTDKPDRLGSLVRAAQACYDVAKIYQTPFISGKDSLNNEYMVDGISTSIPPTLLISAIGVINDISKVISMDLKEPGNLIYIVGQTYEELGGSHYYELLGEVGNNVPQVRAKQAKLLMDKLSKAINEGLVRAGHDCSEGGIGVAAAEMAFSGGIGVEIDLKKVPFVSVQRSAGSVQKKRNDTILFSESNSRFIVEVPKKSKAKFEKIMAGSVIGLIGKSIKEKTFKVKGLDNKIIVKAKLDELKEAWQKTLRW